FELAGRYPAEIFVNIQGDEPLLDPEHVDALLRPFDETPSTLVSTLRTPMDAEEARNPNNVKVVSNSAGQALYFSRWPIPFDRDGKRGVRYFKHLGFYAYRRMAL